jgi:hypothetical protein
MMKVPAFSDVFWAFSFSTGMSAKMKAMALG